MFHGDCLRCFYVIDETTFGSKEEAIESGRKEAEVSRWMAPMAPPLVVLSIVYGVIIAGAMAQKMQELMGWGVPSGKESVFLFLAVMGAWVVITACFMLLGTLLWFAIGEAIKAIKNKQSTKKG